MVPGGNYIGKSLAEYLEKVSVPDLAARLFFGEAAGPAYFSDVDPENLNGYIPFFAQICDKCLIGGGFRPP